MTTERNRRLFVLCGVFAGLLLTGGVWTFSRHLSTRARYGLDWQSEVALSGEQIRKVVAAVGRYEQTHGRRPVDLEALVKDKLLAKHDLFAEDRETIPAIDHATGRFASNPDVVYFPAVRKGDPGDLVLLCTLLLREPGDKYHVIQNDGRHVRMTPRDLIDALNRTYWYLGAKLQSSLPWPAEPVATPPDRGMAE